MSSSVAEKLANKSARTVNTKQVRLKLVHVDFWSAVKLSFLLSLGWAIVQIVLVFLVWMILNQTVFDSVSKFYAEVSGQASFDLRQILGLNQVMGFTLVVALLNLVVGTALGAVGAALYNLSVRITGGLLVGFTNQ